MTNGTVHLARQGRPAASEQWKVDARLLAAARDVFIERGYAAATIDAIVRRAQASKRTVYSRFGDKAALFEAAVSDVIERQFAPTEALVREAAANRDLPVRDRLLHIGEAFLKAATDPVSRALDALVSAQAGTFPKLVARLQAQGHDRAVAIVYDLIDRAGGARPGLAAETFYAMLVLAPMRTDHVEGMVKPVDCEAVVDFVLAGTGLGSAPVVPAGADANRT